MVIADGNQIFSAYPSLKLTDVPEWDLQNLRTLTHSLKNHWVKIAKYLGNIFHLSGTLLRTFYVLSHLSLLKIMWTEYYD